MKPIPEIRGLVLVDEPMSAHTSLKVGGNADYFAVPEDAEDLCRLVSWFDAHGISRMTIGRGYNLLVRDGGIRGAVISLERFDRIMQGDGCMVLAEAGADNLDVVRFAQRKGLGGIGFISGIPGTIGGAVRMNAGAYGGGILEKVESLTLLKNGEIKCFGVADLNFGYRHLELDPDDIILTALLMLEPCDPAVTEEQIKKDLELRRTKHNVGYPSAGSFFKNPPGEASWRLIDGAGMRGAAVGGAQVSEVHSNFLVNTGNASASDFIQLARKIKDAVYSSSGIMLEEEVRIAGEDNP